MDFGNFHAKEIPAVAHYIPSSLRWNAKNRKNHIVGIQLRGKALHTFSHGEFLIAENCIYFLNQKDDYRVELIEPTEAFSIHFTTYEEITTDSFCLPAVNAANILSILQKAETAKATNNEHALHSFLYLLCAEFERIRKKTYSPKDKRMLLAKDYIDLHFRESDCLDTAIQQSGICSRRFGELFRNAYDTTPGKYLTARKIEYAKSLLSTGNISVTDVAALCNFSDVYYFSKVFKHETGVSPGKWK